MCNERGWTTVLATCEPLTCDLSPVCLLVQFVWQEPKKQSILQGGTGNLASEYPMKLNGIKTTKADNGFS